MAGLRLRTWCVGAVVVTVAGLLTGAPAARAAVSCGGADTLYVGYFDQGSGVGSDLATVNAADGSLVGAPVKLSKKSGLVMEIAPAADGRMVYATAWVPIFSGSQGHVSTTVAFDVAAREVAALEGNNSTSGPLAVAADGKLLYTISDSQKKLKVVGLEAGSTTRYFAIRWGVTNGLVLSADGSRLVLIHPLKQWISVVDAKTGVELGGATTGNPTVDVVMSWDGRLAYVLTTDGYLTEFDLTSWQRRTLKVGDRPVGLVLSPDGARLFVTGNGPQNGQGDSLRRGPTWAVSVDTASLGGVQQLAKSGLNPKAHKAGQPAVTSNGQCVYFVNGGRLTVVNTKDGSAAELMDAPLGVVAVSPGSVVRGAW